MTNLLTEFLDRNARLVDEALEALAGMPDDVYTRCSTVFGAQRIGAQVRHVIEFYECLFAGAVGGVINYDARRRDPSVESDRRVAIERLGSIRNRLLIDPTLREDCSLFVSPEGGGPCDAFSSLARELQAIESHTVHHFALIAMLMQAAGIKVPADFGVSRATARYRVQSAASREAA